MKKLWYSRVNSREKKFHKNELNSSQRALKEDFMIIKKIKSFRMKNIFIKNTNFIWLPPKHLPGKKLINSKGDY